MGLYVYSRLKVKKTKIVHIKMYINKRKKDCQEVIFIIFIKDQIKFKISHLEFH